MSLIDLASLVLSPTATKEGKVYSAIPDTGEGDMTFSRGSSATRVNSEGLIEKERVNLLLQSNTFNTTWGLENLSVTSGQSGYDGSSDAWKVTPSIDDTYHRLTNTVSGASNMVVTLSVYAKADGYNFIRVSENGTTGDYATFNLSTGIVENNTSLDAKIESIGSGWYRCSSTIIPAATHRFDMYVMETATVQQPWDGDGVSGILIQDAMLNLGLVAQPYIETTTTAVYEGITDDVPRVDYSGGGCPSLLLEPQRTNLVTNSEYVSSSDYVTGNWTGTITTNTSETLSPEGLYNATKFVKSGSTDRVYFQTSVSDGTYTGSMYFKAVSGQEGNTIEISVRRFGGGSGATTKLITLSSEWQRVDVTATLSGGTNTAIYIADFSSTGNANSFYCYGVQLEAGSYSTSYINSYGTSTTRVADSCSKTGISELIGQSEGTIFVNAKVTLNGRLLLIGAAGNFIETLIKSSGKVNAFVRTSVTEADILSTTTYSTGDTLKIAFAYKQNDFALYVNGTAQGTDTSGNVPTNMSQLIINDYLSAGYNSSNGYNQTILFPTRLTNDQLAELTK